MRLTHTHTSLRRGFTLVEVLVAAGLCMLIMVMVTTAFQKAMDTLSQLKSVAEMQQRLRAVEQIMRSDLESDHFEGGTGNRVRDQRLDLLKTTTGLMPDSLPFKPAAQGFFRVQQGKVNDGTSQTIGSDLHVMNYGKSILEGFDNDGVPSTRATTTVLQMTAKRTASRGDKVFSTPVPSTMSTSMQSMNMLQINNTSNTLTSDWAEISYFLDNDYGNVGQTPGGLKLFGLYRRVRVLPSSGNPSSMNAQASMSGLNANDRSLMQGVSYSPTNGRVNSPGDVRSPSNRLGAYAPNMPVQTAPGLSLSNIQAERVGNALTGSDLLVNDVISFEVKADWDGGTRNPGQSDSNPNLDLSRTYEYPFSDLPEVPSGRNQVHGTLGYRVFDTWVETKDATGKIDAKWYTPNSGTNDCLPQPMRLRAIQIKVRVWDRKNNMARQVTIIQDL